MGTTASQRGAQPELRVTDATKVYGTRSGDLLALHQCSLDVFAGEIVSIMGPSGCGKTTLLWSMSGLHGLTTGRVLIDGIAVAGPNPEIGMVLQGARLLTWRYLDANIRFSFEVMGTKPDRASIDELLRRVGPDGFGGRFPRELSGGMQQRAALVRARSCKPSALLMDEPFGALDAFTREETNRMVEAIWLEAPTTIVLITHSIDEAIFLSDRIVVLSPRPGRVAGIHRADFPRPRSREAMATREAFDLHNRIKAGIVGVRQSRFPPAAAGAANQSVRAAG